MSKTTDKTPKTSKSRGVKTVAAADDSAPKSARKTSSKKTATAKTPARSARSTRSTAAAKPTRARTSIAAVDATGKNLVIVESPAKAKTLTGYLGPNYVVQATVGHLIDLPPKRLGVDVENEFEPEYEVIEGKENVLAALKKSARDAAEIYIATDPDREGEAIAFHVARELRNGHRKKMHRVLFNEITRSGVLKAMSKPGDIAMPKVDAQQARRVLDRLVGYLVSPLLQKIVARGLSAGRVQSVALRLICEREEEIRAFVKEEYWTVEAYLRTAKKEIFLARLVKIKGEKPDLKDEASTQAAVAEIQKHPFNLTDLKVKPASSRPYAPYTTSTLQQDASRRLGYSNDRTMAVAQALYEGVSVGKELVGLITYMRTDSTRISPEAIGEAREFIGSQFGAEYLPEQARVYVTKKSAQDAHEAIRPTSVLRDPASVKKYLTPEQFKLYEMIWQRFVAGQMADARFEVTTATLLAGPYEFRASGRRLTFPGHLAVLGAVAEEKRRTKETEEEDDDITRDLPKLEVGKTYAVDKITPTQHFTEPPPRYNAGSLVKTLDELGIGRPSTYASIISVLVRRRYIETVERRFHPTTLGETVSKVLVDQFPDIFNVDFTAKMEGELDLVENEEYGWREVIKDFYTPFSKRLLKVEKNRVALKEAQEEVTDKMCPDCGSPLIMKWGRSGQFLGCSNYPECRHTEPLEHEKAPEVKETFCPNCGKPMAPKKSRFGWFLGCTGYPECKTTLPLNNSESVACPRCGTGMVSQKRSRRGAFWGCSRYPDCDFISSYKPVAEPCPNCGNPYMEDKDLKSGHFHQCPKCKHKVDAKEGVTA